MNYLTPQQVLAIHDAVIKRTGGSHGLRDVGLLESAVYRPQASYDGGDLYPTLFEKAAALFHSLLKNHPFVDGNKRTSLASAGLFLQINNLQLVNTHEKELEFALKVENASLTFEEITLWFKQNTKKLST
ncbi:MAG: type II toxin-antitoxin system death-on-curing family toxin [Patescibacteria group bacterium]